MNKPKERPILFSGPMIRAILDGRKTQTRRVIKPAWSRCLDLDDPDDRKTAVERCRHGKPGDRLWVRETWNCLSAGTDQLILPNPRPNVCAVAYQATEKARHAKFPDSLLVDRWRPSIHMPRWASRITLEIIAVRVEQLQDITEADAIAEGIELRDGKAGVFQSHKQAFAWLWHEINGPESWAANPWVWVIEFRKTEKES
jgi:hypothetical protein